MYTVIIFNILYIIMFDIILYIVKSMMTLEWWKLFELNDSQLKFRKHICWHDSKQKVITKEVNDTINNIPIKSKPFQIHIV